MKSWLLILLLLLAMSSPVLASGYGYPGDVGVGGYQRQDGTQVQPHFRTQPDGMSGNNYSSPGNSNPHHSPLRGYNSGGDGSLGGTHGGPVFGNQGGERRQHSSPFR